MVVPKWATFSNMKSITTTNNTGLDFPSRGLLMDSFFGTDFKSFFDLARRETSYPHDLYEHEGNFILEVPLAGYSKDEVTVETKNDTLFVSVNKSEVNEKSKYFSRKIKKSNLSLSLFLGNSVQSDKITATLENGLLKIIMPKGEENKSNLIKIN